MPANGVLAILFQSRAKMVSHFMCGVAVPSEVPGGRPSVFHSFCKVCVLWRDLLFDEFICYRVGMWFLGNQGCIQGLGTPLTPMKV